LPKQLTNRFGVDVAIIDFIDHGQCERIDCTENIEPFSPMSPFYESTDFTPEIAQHSTKNKMGGIHKEDLALTLFGLL
jgi:hypothetical protein